MAQTARFDHTLQLLKHPQKGHFKGSKGGIITPNAVTLLLITRKVLGIFTFGKKF